jgi:hypothetical protein
MFDWLFSRHLRGREGDDDNRLKFNCLSATHVRREFILLHCIGRGSGEIGVASDGGGFRY